MPHTATGLITRLLLGLASAACVVTAAWADAESSVVDLMRSGRTAAAMSVANQQIALHPRSPNMRFLKALMLQEAGRHTQAIATYRKLIEDYPALPEPYNNLAALYAAIGEPDKARDTWELAARASRSLAITHEKLGDVYADLATRTYRQALQSGDQGGEAAPPPPVIRQLIPGAGNGTAAPVSGSRQ